MSDKVRALVERRIIEAGEKRLTKKLYSIAKMLGHPIIESHQTDNCMRDVWQLPEEEIPSYHDDEWSHDERGFYFDGLRCGINLCVKALVYDEQLHEIKASYNGYKVYHEEEGRLMAYAPFPEWERQVEMFYEGSLQREKRESQKLKEKKKEQKKKRTEAILGLIRTLWGY